MGSDSKNIGNGFENDFRRLCHGQGLAVSQIYDGFVRVGAGGLLPKHQACDWVVSYKGQCALIDTKTQGEGSTFAKGNVNLDQLALMRPHAMQGIPCGYLVYFRNRQKLVFFSIEVLERGLRGIEDGLLLGNLFNCDLKKIFSVSQTLDPLQPPQE